MPDNIGKRIRDARMLKHMTQEDLARAVGTTKQNIYKYENGIITNIPLDNLEKIADALGVNPEGLAGWSSDKAETVDMDRLEAMHQNPRLGLLFDRQRNMSEADIEFMLQFADRIVKERDND